MASVWLDRFGVVSSLTCAVHCALLPVVIGLLPLAGQKLLGSEQSENILVVCSATLAGTSLALGYRRHRRPHALIFLAVALGLLCGGRALDAYRATSVALIFLVLGGSCLALSHWLNLFLNHRHSYSLLKENP
jgi:MerC mercury resistance protein